MSGTIQPQELNSAWKWTGLEMLEFLDLYHYIFFKPNDPCS